MFSGNFWFGSPIWGLFSWVVDRRFTDIDFGAITSMTGRLPGRLGNGVHSTSLEACFFVVY